MSLTFKNLSVVFKLKPQILLSSFERKFNATDEVLIIISSRTRDFWCVFFEISKSNQFVFTRFRANLKFYNFDENQFFKNVSVFLSVGHDNALDDSDMGLYQLKLIKTTF